MKRFLIRLALVILPFSLFILSTLLLLITQNSFVVFCVFASFIIFSISSSYWSNSEQHRIHHERMKHQEELWKQYFDNDKKPL